MINRAILLLLWFLAALCALPTLLIVIFILAENYSQRTTGESIAKPIIYLLDVSFIRYVIILIIGLNIASMVISIIIKMDTTFVTSLINFMNKYKKRIVAIITASAFARLVTMAFFRPLYSDLDITITFLVFSIGSIILLIERLKGINDRSNNG